MPQAVKYAEPALRRQAVSVPTLEAMPTPTKIVSGFTAGLRVPLVSGGRVPAFGSSEMPPTGRGVAVGVGGNVFTAASTSTGALPSKLVRT